MDEEANQRAWKKLSEHKPLAGFVAFAGVGLFTASFMGVDEPYNNTLATLAFVIAAGGAWWLWQIKKEQDRLIRQRLSLRDGEKTDIPPN